MEKKTWKSRSVGRTKGSRRLRRPRRWRRKGKKRKIGLSLPNRGLWERKKRVQAGPGERKNRDRPKAGNRSDSESERASDLAEVENERRNPVRARSIRGEKNHQGIRGSVFTGCRETEIQGARQRNPTPSTEGRKSGKADRRVRTGMFPKKKPGGEGVL